nr:EOG090X0FH3 [Cyclestheria hislopi]
MNGSFRITVWDPPLIISQILTMQCVMYISLGLWIVLLLHILAGQPISIEYIFKYQEVNIKDISGLIVCYLLNSLICAASLWAIVQRTKLCLDFSATSHLIHFIACWMYNATWPMSAAWWILQISCITITCVLGEFLCLRSEMKAIPLGMPPKVDL